MWAPNWVTNSPSRTVQAREGKSYETDGSAMMYGTRDGVSVGGDKEASLGPNITLV